MLRLEICLTTSNGMELSRQISLFETRQSYAVYTIELSPHRPGFPRIGGEVNTKGSDTNENNATRSFASITVDNLGSVSFTYRPFRIINPLAYT